MFFLHHHNGVNSFFNYDHLIKRPASGLKYQCPNTSAPNWLHYCNYWLLNPGLEKKKQIEKKEVTLYYYRTKLHLTLTVCQLFQTRTQSLPNEIVVIKS